MRSLSAAAGCETDDSFRLLQITNDLSLNRTFNVYHVWKYCLTHAGLSTCAGHFKLHLIMWRLYDSRVSQPQRLLSQHFVSFLWYFSHGPLGVSMCCIICTNTLIIDECDFQRVKIWKILKHVLLLQFMFRSVLCHDGCVCLRPSWWVQTLKHMQDIDKSTAKCDITNL